MAEDNLRTELINAIAYELVQLGYAPSRRAGELQRDSEPARLVHEDVWRAVNQIVAEHQHTTPS